MAKHIPLQHPLVTSSCSIIFVIVLAFVPTLAHSLTLQSDVEALKSLLNAIEQETIPASSFLSTWDFKGDPCESTGAKFLGVLCSIPSDNSTSRIISIDLSGAGYHGTLSPSIGNLTKLTSLDLSRNRLRGRLPDTLKNLKKLTRISISGNNFMGNIDGWIHELKKVERIDLSDNMLSGEIPARISELRRLIHLSLSNNHGLSGRIPDMNGLWQLRTLDLASNILEKRLPKLPTSLRTLNLSHNRLSGHFAPLGMLKQLRSIDVSHNRFSGSISRGILSLPRLEYLNVSHNGLTTIEVNNSRGSDTPLRVIDAQWNNLHGHLPPNLVNLGRLRVTNLANNRLTGRIPRSYGERLGRPWRTLFLDHNFLSGPLPPQFSSSMGRIRGSLAHNCLRCPANIPLCRGRQRPASDCMKRMLVEKIVK
ncbi:hypothetical protein PTKIN_Ptkin17bG0032600 [Pterospermum kingtungense]